MNILFPSRLPNQKCIEVVDAQQREKDLTNFQRKFSTYSLFIGAVFAAHAAYDYLTHKKQFTAVYAITAVTITALNALVYLVVRRNSLKARGYTGDKLTWDECISFYGRMGQSMKPEAPTESAPPQRGSPAPAPSPAKAAAKPAAPIVTQETPQPPAPATPTAASPAKPAAPTAIPETASPVVPAQPAAPTATAITPQKQPDEPVPAPAAKPIPAAVAVKRDPPEPLTPSASAAQDMREMFPSPAPAIPVISPAAVPASPTSSAASSAASTPGSATASPSVDDLLLKAAAKAPAQRWNALPDKR